MTIDGVQVDLKSIVLLLCLAVIMFSLGNLSGRHIKTRFVAEFKEAWSVAGTDYSAPKEAPKEVVITMATTQPNGPVFLHPLGGVVVMRVGGKHIRLPVLMPPYEQNLN